MTAYSLGKNVRKTLSRALHGGLTRAGVGGDKHCCACGTNVSGFTFFSYRPCHCPRCKSTPRERFVNYAFEEGLVPEPSRSARVLHVAPGERSLVRRFQSLGDYVAGDVCPERYPEVDCDKLDLTAMSYDEPFDLIYASHVLEHVVEDRLAMRRMFEHLKPGGCAIILVPIRGGVTDEGSLGLNAKERIRRFGRHDHVRQYGLDIAERLKSEGFEVVVIDAGALSAELIEEHGFETHGYLGDAETDRIFVCTRRAADRTNV